MRRLRRGRGWSVMGLLLGAQLAAAGCGGGGTATGSSADTPSRTTAFDFGSNNALRATAFGDSITIGVLEERIRDATSVTSGLQTSNNYPNNLQAMLRGLDPAWRVINRGKGGERTRQGAGRFPGVLATDKPGFVLIMEGSNDASRDEDPALIVANLEAMVLVAQGNKTIPIIATIPPDFRNDPNAQNIINKANAGIRTMAKARGVALAEIFNGMNDRTLFGQAPDRDPLHPNERGYVLMAGIWFTALQQVIPPPPPPPAPAPAPADPTGSPPANAGQHVKRR